MLHRLFQSIYWIRFGWPGTQSAILMSSHALLVFDAFELPES